MKKQFKCGDLGWWDQRDGSFIPVAVVHHMLKDNVLCFVRRFAGNTPFLSWDEILEFDHPYQDLTKYNIVDFTDDGHKLMDWIFQEVRKESQWIPIF